MVRLHCAGDPEQRIYWCEGSRSSIEVSDYRGLNRHIIRLHDNGGGRIIVGLSSLVDDHLIYFDSTTRSLRFYLRKTRNIVILLKLYCYSYVV